MNHFEAFAEVITPAPVQRKQRAAAKRAVTIASRKKLEEMNELDRMYRHHRRVQMEELLDGPFGKGCCRPARISAEHDDRLRAGAGAPRSERRVAEIRTSGRPSSGPEHGPATASRGFA